MPAFSERFETGFDNKIQCKKLIGAWPIKNVWGTLKMRLSKHECETLWQLRSAITREWRVNEEDNKGSPGEPYEEHH